jgi:WD40 repeat protein
VSARHDHGARLRCLALAPGGDLLATGSYDGGVAIGAPLGSAALARGQGHEGPVVGCAWVGDRLVSVGMDGTLRSWSAGAEPTACVAAHTDGAVGVAALSNDQLITVGGDGRVCLWRLNAAGDASLDHELDLGVALDGLGAETQTGRAPRLLVGDRYGGAHAIELRR